MPDKNISLPVGDLCLTGGWIFLVMDRQNFLTSRKSKTMSWHSTCVVSWTWTGTRPGQKHSNESFSIRRMASVVMAKGLLEQKIQTDFTICSSIDGTTREAKIPLCIAWRINCRRFWSTICRITLRSVSLCPPRLLLMSQLRRNSESELEKATTSGKFWWEFLCCGPFATVTTVLYFRLRQGTVVFLLALV